VNVKQGKGCEEGEWTPTKTKKVKLGWGCEEGENVNEDDEGAKLGQGLAKAASMAKPAPLSCSESIKG